MASTSDPDEQPGDNTVVTSTARFDRGGGGSDLRTAATMQPSSFATADAPPSYRDGGGGPPATSTMTRNDSPLVSPAVSNSAVLEGSLPAPPASSTSPAFARTGAPARSIIVPDSAQDDDCDAPLPPQFVAARYEADMMTADAAEKMARKTLQLPDDNDKAAPLSPAVYEMTDEEAGIAATSERPYVSRQSVMPAEVTQAQEGVGRIVPAPPPNPHEQGLMAGSLARSRDGVLVSNQRMVLPQLFEQDSTYTATARSRHQHLSQGGQRPTEMPASNPPPSSMLVSPTNDTRRESSAPILEATVSPTNDTRRESSAPILEATLVQNEPRIPIFSVKFLIIVSVIVMVLIAALSVTVTLLLTQSKDRGDDESSSAVTGGVDSNIAPPPSFTSPPTPTLKQTVRPTDATNKFPTASPSTEGTSQLSTNSTSTQSLINFSTANPSTETPGTNPTARPPAAFAQSSSIELVPSEVIVPHFSHRSVAIYDSTVVVGAPYNNGSRGVVFVFVRDADGEWSQQAKLEDPDGSEVGNFGESVAIHVDTIVVGAFKNNELGKNSGLAHVFVRNSATWSHQSKLLDPEGAAGDQFGRSVAIFDDTIVVGADGDGENGEYSGMAHVFLRSGTTWSHESKLPAPDGAAYDYFGASVAIFQDTAVVGAHDDDDMGYNSGSTHVYVRSEGAWSHQAKLLAPDGAPDDHSAWSVAIFEDTVVVSVRYDDDKGVDSGAANIFVRNGTSWSHQFKLLAPAGSDKDQFSISVALYQDTVIVGEENFVDGWDNGAAHVFVRNEAVWAHQSKLSAPGGAANNDGRGASTAIHNSTMAIHSGGSGKTFVFSG